jgi:DNA-binding CsgD family transcriptional regulator
MISIRSHKMAPWSSTTASEPPPLVRFATAATPMRSEVAHWDACKLLCPDWRGPALVLDCATLRVAYANRNCIGLFKKDISINISTGTLAFELCHQRKEFQAKIQNAITTGLQSTAFTLRTTDGSWVMAILRILNGLEADAVTGNHHDREFIPAIIEFSECHYQPDPVCFAAVADALKLSPSESRDLIAIATGQSPDEIAANSNVAISTVRQRIKSLLAKTESTRQQHLTCLVRSLCPARHDIEEVWHPAIAAE